MLLTMVIWIYVLFLTIPAGFAGFALLKKSSHIERAKPHIILILGLVILTVYAEIFSLFYKVSLLANIIAIVFTVFFIYIFHGEIRTTFSAWKQDYSVYAILFTSILFALTALRASTEINDGDTYLYHLQAIRWITDYGIVPGLGNLNTRFAFNSAFLPLQALFTFDFVPWIMPQHSMNGLVAWIILSYAVCEMEFWRKPGFYISDFVKIVIVYIITRESKSFSSPGTDIFASTVVMYIFSEWTAEKTRIRSNENTNYRSFLCILAVFAMTLKMSTAFVVLLVIDPAYDLIKKKDFRHIILYIFFGVSVLLPFLIRNVIISGWILYPFDKLDFFNFDWKIPSATVADESLRTLLGAKKIYNMLPSDSTFNVWFPHWVEIYGKSVLVYIVGDCVCCIISVILSIKLGKKTYNYSMLIVSVTLIICLIYLAVSAPNLRYGRTFMFLLPAITVGMLLNNKTIPNQSPAIIVMMTIIFTIFIPKIYTCSEIMTVQYYLEPASYIDYRGIPYEFNGQILFIPETSGGANAIGWDYFPSAMYEESIERLELRGNTYKNGFRVKEGIEHLF